MANKIQNQVAVTAANDNTKTLRALIKSAEGEIKKALPSVLTPERFTRMINTAISTNPKLGDCTPMSFIGAMLAAAQLGLEPNTQLGQAYIIPYYNGKTNKTEAQFQIGYKGLLDLAYRSGEVEIVQAHVVYENDEFDCEFGLEPKLRHVPAAGDRGAPVKVYAMFRTKNGGYGFDVCSMDEVRNHAKKYSKAYNYGPWQTNFEEMAKKTVLKKVLKYAPLKSDFVRGMAADETIKSSIAEDMSEVPDETVIEVTGSTVETDENGEVMEAVINEE